ncbi:MAG TPA: 30S ribosomal protein S20 [Planctomycetota bacterium]|nr:30S ribosomal protein S20 [Planctomycetota bacterium]
MPRSETTKKRIRQNTRRRLHNRAATGAVRAQVKKFLAAVDGSDAEAREAGLRAAVRALDKAAARGVLHKNAAARRKARLVAKLKKAAATPAPQA